MGHTAYAVGSTDTLSFLANPYVLCAIIKFHTLGAILIFRTLVVQLFDLVIPPGVVLTSKAALAVFFPSTKARVFGVQFSQLCVDNSFRDVKHAHFEAFLFRMRNTKPTFTPATFVGIFARVEAWFLLSGYTTLSLRRAATQAPDCKSFNPSRSLAIVFLYVFCFDLDTLRPGPVVRATDVERIRLAPGRIVCSRAEAAPSLFPFVAGPRSATYSLHVNRQTLFSRATVLSLGRLWRKGIHPGSAAYCFAVINASYAVLGLARLGGVAPARF